MRLSPSCEVQVEMARSHFEEIVPAYDDRCAFRSLYVDNLDARTLDLIQQRGPQRHLDVGCGTGRLLRKIRSAGFDCRSIGIDLSPSMIARCRSEGLEAEVYEFGQFETKERFDLVTMQFGVYGYLAIQYRQKDVLQKAIELLTPDGVFLFDVLNPYCVTYGPLRRTLPELFGRMVSSMCNGGIVVRKYLGKSQTPIAMAMITDRKLDKILRSLDCAYRKVWLRYSRTGWTHWPPLVLSAHRLVCAARNQRTLKSVLR